MARDLKLTPAQHFNYLERAHVKIDAYPHRQPTALNNTLAALEASYEPLLRYCRCRIKRALDAYMLETRQ
jgi:hypothetical protein